MRKHAWNGFKHQRNSNRDFGDGNLKTRTFAALKMLSILTGLLMNHVLADEAELSGRAYFWRPVVSATDSTPRNSQGSTVEIFPDDRLLLGFSQYLARGGHDHGRSLLMSMYSDDQGVTWSDPEPLPTGEAKMNFGGSSFLMLPDRLLFGFWARDTEKVASMYLIESRDHGKSWSERWRITPETPGWGTEWTTTNNDRLLRLSSGRLLFPCQVMASRPDSSTERGIVVGHSDDSGKNWRWTEVLEFKDSVPGHAIPPKAHEPSVVELSDGSLYMLVRATRGMFFEARSTDSGETWSALVPSDIPSMTAPPYLKKLQDGRIVLLWNRPSEAQMADPRFKPVMFGYLKRHTLSLAVSNDDARSWSKPMPILHDGGEHGFTYPWLQELEDPGELLIFCTRTPEIIYPGDMVMTRVPLGDLP